MIVMCLWHGNMMLQEETTHTRSHTRSVLTTSVSVLGFDVCARESLGKRLCAAIGLHCLQV